MTDILWRTTLAREAVWKRFISKDNWDREAGFLVSWGMNGKQKLPVKVKE